MLLLYCLLIYTDIFMYFHRYVLCLQVMIQISPTSSESNLILLIKKLIELNITA